MSLKPINEDIELFNLLGLTPTEKQKDNNGKVEIRKEQVVNSENEKWSRPGHTIERNVEATEKGKEIRRELKETN